jgi:hypothetical protein
LLRVNKEMIITEILIRCEDSFGFINQLGSHLVFDAVAYEELYGLYEQYITLLGDEVLVNRYIARFAVDLVMTIEGAITKMEKRNHEDVVKVQRAHAQMLDVLYRLLP